MSEDQFAQKLQALMADAVADLGPPTVLPGAQPLAHRSRHASLVAALIAVAIALAVGVAVHVPSASTRVHTAGIASSATIDTSTTVPPGVSLALPPENALPWAYRSRGSLAPLENPGDIDSRAATAWYTAHGVPSDVGLQYPPWSGSIGDKDVVLMAMSSYLEDQATAGYNAIWVETRASNGRTPSDGRLVLDERSSKDLPAVVGRISTTDGDSLLAVGPFSSSISYGNGALPNVRPVQSGDGWAVFPALPPSDPGVVTVLRCATCTPEQVPGA